MRLPQLIDLTKTTAVDAKSTPAPSFHPDPVDSISCGLCGDIIPLGFEISDQDVAAYEWDELLCRTCLDRAICIEDVIDDLDQARNDDSSEC